MVKLKTGTIRARLLIGFVLIALLPLISAAAGSVIVGVINGRQQAYERLESVAVSKELAIQRWADSLQQQLSLVSYSDSGYERISVVVSLAQDDKYLRFYNKAVRNRLQGFLGQSQELQNLFVVDTFGRIALSTNAEQEGQSIAGQTYLERARVAPYVEFTLPESGSISLQSVPMVTVGAPVAGVRGQEPGIIGAQVSLDALEGVLDDQTGLGETGKSYLVSSEGIVLAGSRSVSNMAAADQLSLASSAGLGEALVTRAAVTGVYNDYRGKRVIGVYRWLPELNALLAVEQDQTEAFEIITATLGINLVVAITALLLAIGLSLVLVRGIVNPLAELADTATQIAAGDLGRTAPVVAEDEIGVLARAFNSMTAQLRELIASLEQRVAERTRDLQRLALRLETSARLGREVTSILEINELLRKVSELIQEAFGYYGVHIYLVDEEANQLVYRGSMKLVPQDKALEIGEGSLNGKAVLQSQALFVNDVTHERSYRLDENFPNTRSELVVPLRIGDRVTGTLDLLSAEPDSFRQEDVLVAQSLADQIAIAIENARLYDRSRELAILEERNRLARELHDSMNQSLYSVVLFTGAAYNQAEKADTESVQRYIARAERMAQQALKEMRLLVYELRPLELEQKGFVRAIQERLDAVEKRAGLEVQFLVPEPVVLPAEMEESLFRIVQEALNNALKHADASMITVELHANDGHGELQVRDNGRGFDPSSGSQTGGLGLVSMRERVSEFEGELLIQSSPDEGTCVIIRFGFLPEDPSGNRGQV